MPLVDLDDPEELRARWSALAAVAHATGFDRRWYADGGGWYHQDETGSDLRMVRLDGGRSVLFGYHTQHSRTAGTDLLAGAPDWIGQPEVKQRIAAGELGFVYGSFNGTWARASYEGDPWQPVDDGFLPIGEWVTSDEGSARELVEWAAEWADYLGGLDELVPLAVGLIRSAGASTLSADELDHFFGRLGIGPRSPQQPDLHAALVAAAQFNSGAAAPVFAPAPVVVEEPEEEELFIVPPGVSPFTGQPIADDADPVIGGAGEPAYEPSPAYEPPPREPQPPRDAPDDGYGVVSKKPRLFGRKKKPREDDNASLAGLGLAAPEPPVADSAPYTYDRPLPSSEPPRVGAPVEDGEDFYASLFADAPAAARYTPDTPTSANEATNELAAVTDDTAPFTPFPEPPHPNSPFAPTHEARDSASPFAPPAGDRQAPAADSAPASPFGPQTSDPREPDPGQPAASPFAPPAYGPEAHTAQPGAQPQAPHPGAPAGFTQPHQPAQAPVPPFAEPPPEPGSPFAPAAFAPGSSPADDTGVITPVDADHPQATADDDTGVLTPVDDASTPDDKTGVIAPVADPGTLDAFTAGDDTGVIPPVAEAIAADPDDDTGVFPPVAAPEAQPPYDEHEAEPQTSEDASRPPTADSTAPQPYDQTPSTSEPQAVQPPSSPLDTHLPPSTSPLDDHLTPPSPMEREWVGGAWINGEWIEDAAAYLAANPHLAHPPRPARRQRRTSPADLPTESIEALPTDEDTPPDAADVRRTSHQADAAGYPAPGDVAPDAPDDHALDAHAGRDDAHLAPATDVDADHAREVDRPAPDARSDDRRPYDVPADTEHAGDTQHPVDESTPSDGRTHRGHRPADDHATDGEDDRYAPGQRWTVHPESTDDPIFEDQLIGEPNAEPEDSPPQPAAHWTSAPAEPDPHHPAQIIHVGQQHPADPTDLAAGNPAPADQSEPHAENESLRSDDAGRHPQAHAFEQDAAHHPSDHDAARHPQASDHGAARHPHAADHGAAHHPHAPETDAEPHPRPSEDAAHQPRAFEDEAPTAEIAAIVDEPTREDIARIDSGKHPTAGEGPRTYPPLSDQYGGSGDELDEFTSEVFHDETLGNADWTADQLGEITAQPPEPQQDVEAVPQSDGAADSAAAEAEQLERRAAAGESPEDVVGEAAEDAAPERTPAAEQTTGADTEAQYAEQASAAGTAQQSTGADAEPQYAQRAGAADTAQQATAAEAEAQYAERASAAGTAQQVTGADAEPQYVERVSAADTAQQPSEQADAAEYEPQQAQQVGAADAQRQLAESASADGYQPGSAEQASVADAQQPTEDAGAAEYEPQQADELAAADARQLAESASADAQQAAGPASAGEYEPQQAGVADMASQSADQAGDAGERHPAEQGSTGEYQPQYAEQASAADAQQPAGAAEHEPEHAGVADAAPQSALQAGAAGPPELAEQTSAEERELQQAQQAGAADTLAPAERAGGAEYQGQQAQQVGAVETEQAGNASTAEQPTGVEDAPSARQAPAAEDAPSAGQVPTAENAQLADEQTAGDQQTVDGAEGADDGERTEEVAALGDAYDNQPAASYTDSYVGEKTEEVAALSDGYEDDTAEVVGLAEAVEAYEREQAADVRTDEQGGEGELAAGAAGIAAAGAQVGGLNGHHPEQTNGQSVDHTNGRADEQLNGHAGEHADERLDAHSADPTDGQLNGRADEHLNGHTAEHPQQHPDDPAAMLIPELSGAGTPIALPLGVEQAMRAEPERPRAKPIEASAFEALRTWCRIRTDVVPSGFTIQVQVLDPNRPSYRFDLEPAQVEHDEWPDDRLSELLGDLWIEEAKTDHGGWLFARIDAAGRTLRIDRWYDQVPEWWDTQLPGEIDVEGLVRRLYRRGPDFQPSYLEQLYITAG
ncbi:hypothetical protein [Kribbella sp. NPDC051770]|uniref:hypothetical protein n=1 Tax=Kribbella sp. NPDC051770 TaxID=3155413 RepID=UPI0034169739